MQASFDSNVQDQRHRAPVDSRFVENLSDKETFKTHLDVADNWTNYLAFFQKEIAIKGVPKTLHEHLFAGDEHANRMMVRWFASMWSSLEQPSGLTDRYFRHLPPCDPSGIRCGIQPARSGC